MQREYWRFYWPLALTGMLMLVADQFENRTLAGYPDAEQQLAVLAFAIGIFGPFRALLVFVPRMVDVLARSRRGHRVCLAFTVAACAVISLPLGVLAFTPPGRQVVRWAFSFGMFFRNLASWSRGWSRPCSRVRRGFGPICWLPGRRGGRIPR